MTDHAPEPDAQDLDALLAAWRRESDLWQKRAERPQDIAAGLLPLGATLGIAGAAGLGVALPELFDGEVLAGLAVLFFVLAFAALLRFAREILRLHGGIPLRAIRLLARLVPDFAKPDFEADVFASNLELAPLPTPQQFLADRSMVRLRLAEVEKARAEAWRLTAEAREKVLRRVNLALLASVVCLIYGGTVYLILR